MSKRTRDRDGDGRALQLVRSTGLALREDCRQLRPTRCGPPLMLFSNPCGMSTAVATVAQRMLGEVCNVTLHPRSYRPEFLQMGPNGILSIVGEDKLKQLGISGPRHDLRRGEVSRAWPNGRLVSWGEAVLVLQNASCETPLLFKAFASERHRWDAKLHGTSKTLARGGVRAVGIWRNPVDALICRIRDGMADRLGGVAVLSNGSLGRAGINRRGIDWVHSQSPQALLARIPNVSLLTAHLSECANGASPYCERHMVDYFRTYHYQSPSAGPSSFAAETLLDFQVILRETTHDHTAGALARNRSDISSGVRAWRSLLLRWGFDAQPHAVEAFLRHYYHTFGGRTAPPPHESSIYDFAALRGALHTEPQSVGRYFRPPFARLRFAESADAGDAK